MKTETKRQYKISEETINKFYGKLWEKNGIRRVYFNALEELFGLTISRYSSGNISSATLDGDSISNSDAKAFVAITNTGKFYYDLNTLHLVAEHSDEPQTLLNHCLRTLKANGATAL